MRVIYLAAGECTRLRPLTDKIHKSMLPLRRGHSIVETFLEQLLESEYPIECVHIVVGHGANKYMNHLGPWYPSRSARKRLSIKYVRNPLYKVTGAAHSLYACSNVLRKTDTLVMEGDHVLEDKKISDLLYSEHKNAVFVDKNTDNLKYDEEVIAYGYAGLVRKFKWLPRYPATNMLGEAPTIFKLSREASTQLAHILQAYLLEDGPARKEIIEPMNRLLELHEMKYILTGMKWTEVDFLSDLEHARRIVN